MDTVERYAGDVAWTEWFERCSVSRCPDSMVPQLTEQIRSAMFAQLARAGFSADLVADDDPVTFSIRISSRRARVTGTSPSKAISSTASSTSGFRCARSSAGPSSARNSAAFTTSFATGSLR